MRKGWVVGLVSLLLVSASFAQTSRDEQAKFADSVFVKFQKLELTYQILPLLFTKDQYKALLPAIEKARENVRVAENEEIKELKKLAPSIEEAVKEAETKGEVPKREVLNAANRVLSGLTVARRAIAEMNTTLVYDAFMKVANAGQKKTAANSLDIKSYLPNAKPEEMSEDAKIRLFVREILLHPQAYELMRKLSM